VQAIVEAAGLNASGDKKRQIVVTGCLAQRYGDSLAADLPEADLVMGFEAYGNLPAALAGRLGLPAGPDSSSSGAAAASSSGRVQVGGVEGKRCSSSPVVMMFQFLFGCTSHHIVSSHCGTH
jgi:ribosomal protein S12 methylthiotransferase